MKKKILPGPPVSGGPPAPPDGWIQSVLQAAATPPPLPSGFAYARPSYLADLAAAVAAAQADPSGQTQPVVTYPVPIPPANAKLNFWGADSLFQGYGILNPDGSINPNKSPDSTLTTLAWFATLSRLAYVPFNTIKVLMATAMGSAIAGLAWSRRDADPVQQKWLFDTWLLPNRQTMLVFKGDLDPSGRIANAFPPYLVNDANLPTGWQLLNQVQGLVDGYVSSLLANYASLFDGSTPIICCGHDVGGIVAQVLASKVNAAWLAANPNKGRPPIRAVYTFGTPEYLYSPTSAPSSSLVNGTVAMRIAEDVVPRATNFALSFYQNISANRQYAGQISIFTKPPATPVVALDQQRVVLRDTQVKQPVSGVYFEWFEAMDTMLTRYALNKTAALRHAPGTYAQLALARAFDLGSFGGNVGGWLESANESASNANY